MAAIDIRGIFRRAWERAKQAERVDDDDPIAEHVQGSVVRTIAELEVRRLNRTESADPTDAAAKKDETVATAA